MNKSEESRKGDSEEFHLKIREAKESQKGKLLRYIHTNESKMFATLQALEAFYLVDALEEYGTRSREDIKKIGKRCIDQLLNQADRIQRKTGLNIKINVIHLEQTELD
jgi:hypothetical protein